MMPRFSGKLVAVAALVAVSAIGTASSANAEDFFSALFGGFGGSQHSDSERAVPLSYAPEGNFGSPAVATPRPVAPRPAAAVSHQAFCVRTCDGRYFPVQVADGQSRAASCNSFCPASPTKVYLGSSIDHATTDGGKSYSSLPNAFKYRSEIVAGCTCNGKDSFGLARINIQDDKTLRRGDIVAGADGLMVAGHSADRRNASLNFSPASATVRANFERLPVVASD